MPMSWAEMGERLEKSLQGSIHAQREEGAPGIGAAIVTVTFAEADGGMDFFTLVETIMSGG